MYAAAISVGKLIFELNHKFNHALDISYTVRVSNNCYYRLSITCINLLLHGTYDYSSFVVSHLPIHSYAVYKADDVECEVTME